MDWGAIGVGFVGLVFGVYQGLRSLASDQRRQREELDRQRKELQQQLRRAFTWGDLVDGWIAAQRMQLRRHNGTEHAQGEGQAVVAELPDAIESGIRAFVDEDEAGGSDK